MQTVIKTGLNAAGSNQMEAATRHHRHHQQYQHSHLPSHHHHQRAALLAARGLKENIAKLAPVDAVQLVTLQPVNHSIPNVPGKKASVAIYAHLASKYGGKITADAAKEGLELYGEYVEEARQVPGSHPNIDILLDVLSNGKELAVEIQQQQQQK